MKLQGVEEKGSSAESVVVFVQADLIRAVEYLKRGKIWNPGVYCTLSPIVWFIKKRMKNYYNYIFSCAWLQFCSSSYSKDVSDDSICAGTDKHFLYFLPFFTPY